MLEIAGVLDDATNRENAVSRIATAQARAGDSAGALRTAAPIKAEYLNGDALKLACQCSGGAR